MLVANLKNQFGLSLVKQVLVVFLSCTDSPCPTIIEKDVCDVYPRPHFSQILSIHSWLRSLSAAMAGCFFLVMSSLSPRRDSSFLSYLYLFSIFTLYLYITVCIVFVSLTNKLYSKRISLTMSFSLSFFGSSAVMKYPSLVYISSSVKHWWGIVFMYRVINYFKNFSHLESDFFWKNTQYILVLLKLVQLE